MISSLEATQLINSHLFQPKIERVKFDSCEGRVLAEPIYADRDFPPFDRVMMDGIAVRHADLADGTTKLEVEGLIAAGDQTKALPSGKKCFEIMTGAVMATGADTVIPYELVEIKDGYAHLIEDLPAQGKHIHYQGMDRKQGDLLLTENTIISKAEIGVLATVGKAEVKVKSLPRVLIVSTGDELVDVETTPLPHQIRKSNVHVLETVCKNLGLPSKKLHVTDDPEQIRNTISRELESTDVLVLSGGVSKGKKDFIPEMLEELGIKKLFHRIAQRPGKPFWFGKSDTITCFAFPGNPVSTFMCTERYFEPWLKNSLGLQNTGWKAKLSEDFHFKPNLTYFLQCKLLPGPENELLAVPNPGQGSGDLANLTGADAFLELPQGKNEFKQGESYTVWPFKKIL